MSSPKRSLRFCIAILVILTLFCSARMAGAFHEIWHPDILPSQPLQVPTIIPVTGDILIDNFEYWDSPYNHGWLQIEPPYPVYGFGMGYAAIFNTVLDLQEGSRVLDVYRPSSVFLLGTPYEKHGIFYYLYTPASPGATSVTDHILLSENPVVSFKFRAPLGIEPWDIFELDIIGETNGGYPITVRIRPIEPSYSAECLEGRNTADGLFGMVSYVSNFIDGASIEVIMDIGRSFLDGSWHIVWVDLQGEVSKAVDQKGITNPSNWCIKQANIIKISGQMFRLDDIEFRSKENHELINHIDYPDLFEFGPLYAQIFEPYRYLFISDYAGAGHVGLARSEDRITDLMFDLGNFITDPNQVRDAWMADLSAIGEDPNYAIPGSSKYGTKQPYLTNLMDRGADFIIDINLPVFSDPNLRFGGNLSGEVREQRTLGWNATIGGYGANGVQSLLVQPLPVNPFDGMPTYLPAYYAAIDAIHTFGKPFYSPLQVFLLESALYNMGLLWWPNIAYMDYTPQYFEDLIVTLEVTNGVHSDVRTFPISVVNYPVENYPPVVQLDIDDQLFYVGQVGEYAITSIDPDCFIFSLSGSPATTHRPAIWGEYRTDMDGLFYQMTLNGLPSYQYGPWQESIIDPHSGLIRFAPKFEGVYDITVSCTDDKGAMSIAGITIFAVNTGKWLNHPPIVLGGPTQPVVIRAGEEFYLHAPNFAVEDPDGDELFASCNIGACGRLIDGSFTWVFQSNFPGFYNVEVVFYDIRGGYAIMEFAVDVKPWWSY